jgi:cellulose synthase/poly-beta-1,6-N-acetylglucosamine synthase-like glycosyltransferase
VNGSEVWPVLEPVLAIVLLLFVLTGAIPVVSAAYSSLAIPFHSFRNHYSKAHPYFPRVAIVVPAWNEGAVIGASIDRLMTLDYPADCLRVYVVDDASTDETPDVVLAKARQFPGKVWHLRREKGGEGKAHTLNHGIREILADDWMQALLIMDADVIYLPDSLRRMTRHLADPEVGAVSAYIREGSADKNYLTRFIGVEYILSQPAARRAQNVLGAQACLAGTRGRTSSPSAGRSTRHPSPRTRSRRSRPSCAVERWSSSRTPSCSPRNPALWERSGSNDSGGRAAMRR